MKNYNHIGFPYVSLPLMETVSPREDTYNEEEDSFCRILLESSIVHPQIDEEINEEDFLNDEYSENSRYI